MKAKPLIVLVLKFVALAILYFLCFTIASGLLFRSAGSPPPSAEEASTTLVSLLAVACLNTGVLTFVILRSRWAGWRLMLAIFVVSYGVTTIMSQIETAVFVTRLPAGMLPRILLMGALVLAGFIPPAVVILGKRKAETGSGEANSRLVMPARDWIWRSGLIAVGYLVLYFSFGYFIAWRSPAVREYYGGTDSGNFIEQMRTVVRDTPWLPFFQMLRGLMWMALALPVIRMMKGRWWEAGLAVALLFSVVMNSQLLIPNPFMPEAVRMAHLVETASSNFLFGWLVVCVLLYRPAHRVLST